MQEVFGILMALAALIAGLLVIGWAYGDFRPRPEQTGLQASQDK